MSLASAFKYQYDPDGNNPSNYITEPRLITAADPSVMVTLEGLFFGDSLVITKNGTPLTEDTDYELVALDAFFTETLGQPVYAGIKIKTANMYNGIELAYQCLGGPEGNATSLIKDLIAAIEATRNNPQVNFEDIVGFPPAIKPSQHKHYPSDLEDLDLLAQKFDDFIDALVSVRFYKDSNHSLHNEILRLTAMVGSLRGTVNGIGAITGYASEIEALENIVNNYEKLSTDNGTIAAGDSQVIFTYNKTKFTTLKMTVSLKDNINNSVQSLDLTFVSNGIDVGSVVNSSSKVGTHTLVNSVGTSHTDDLMVNDAADILTITWTPPRNSEFSTKIMSVL